MNDGLKAKHRQKIIDILAACSGVERVVLFGSRATGTYTDTSDIDLALFGDSLTLTDQAKLARRIEESTIPQKVDLIRYHTIKEETLKTHIQQDGIEWFKRNPGKSRNNPQSNTAENPNSEWKDTTFDKAVSLNPSVPLKRGEKYFFVDMKAIDASNRSVSESEIRVYKNGGSKFMPGDTLMARITPCLENGKIARYMPSKGSGPAHGSTEFIVIRGKDGISDNDFAYYLTRWEHFRNFAISQMTGSSGRQRVPTDSLSKFSFRLPPLSEQKRIAGILGSLDDKIELNRRMNETLEAMARALFKSWFVDFDPVIDNALSAGNDIPEPLAERAAYRQSLGSARKPLPEHIKKLFPAQFQETDIGPIPKGWEYLTFEELVRAKQGKYLEKNKMKDNPDAEFKFPVWGGNGIRGYSREAMYTESVVLLTCRGSNCGLIKLTESPSWVSNIAFACEPKYGSANFLYIYLSKCNLNACVSGSAQPQITYNALKNRRMEFPVAPEACKAICKQLDLWYELILRNNQKSELIARTRDTLLPKLISGQLRVPEAEEMAEDVI